MFEGTKAKLAHDTVIVDLNTLDKVLQANSGVCHRFVVAKSSPNRVKVGYSNPNEYGTDNWTYATYPAYHNKIGGENVCIVVLEIIRMVNDPLDENWQAFDFIKDAVKKEVSGK